MVFYTFGYPLLVLGILYKNRYRVMEDQLLRAEDMGKTRLENPHCYDLRKMYHKLYYHFRPDCWFWILLVLSRKFIIAMTALMFSRNPAFQMAICLLALFIAYALQVRFSPYMSMSEREEIIFQHKRQVELGNRTHAMLASIISDVKRQGKKVVTRMDMEGKQALIRQRAANFFWNYNTVESVLLFCAVLVNLAGVMFESGQLDLPGYGAQKDFITYVILLVIVFSIVYFASVLVSEVYIMCKAHDEGKAAKKGQGKGKDGIHAKSDSRLLKDGPSSDGSKAKSGLGSKRKGSLMPISNPGEFVMATAESMNPMFKAVNPLAASGGTVKGASSVTELLEIDMIPSKDVWDVIRDGYRQALATNEQLQKDLVTAKKQQQAALSQAATTMPMRRTAVKREFAPSANNSAASAGATPLLNVPTSPTDDGAIAVNSSNGDVMTESPLPNSPQSRAAMFEYARTARPISVRGRVAPTQPPRSPDAPIAAPTAPGAPEPVTAPPAAAAEPTVMPAEQ